MAKAIREKVHDVIRTEIKDTARRLMATSGTSGLSIRAIARDMEMTAPALYHYYRSMDDLITDLILDAFNALGEAVEKGGQVGTTPTKKLMNALLALRQWALDYPVQFQLIYGNPIPNYSAPRDVTVPAATRTFTVIVNLLIEIIHGGDIVVPEGYRQVPASFEASLREQVGADAPPEVITAMVLGTMGWVQIHGVIMLELFNHLQPLSGNVDTFYRHQLEVMFRQFGINLT